MTFCSFLDHFLGGVNLNLTPLIRWAFFLCAPAKPGACLSLYCAGIEMLSAPVYFSPHALEGRSLAPSPLAPVVSAWEEVERQGCERRGLWTLEARFETLLHRLPAM